MKVIAKKNRELALINAQNTQNENRAEIITLVVPEEYEDYNKKIVFITDDETVWDIITNNEYKITNAITKYKQVDFYIWLTKEVDGESIDFRTKTKTLNFYHNEDASDEITPEEISGVNTVVNILEEEIDKVENLNLEAEKVGTVTTLTITKKDGTTQEVEILDGAKGDKGDAPIRGVDYWTEEDEQEIIDESTVLINGKIEEYNDNATQKITEYNSNATQKLNSYNQNATQKTTDYNTNASEKLSLYNQNATQKTNAYDTNASDKLTAYNTNATQKVTDYNTNANNKTDTYNSNATQKINAYDTNASDKLENYNTNATQKLNAYNTNATEKTQAFDEHTEEIQEEIEKLQTENARLKATLPTTTGTGQAVTLEKTAELEFVKPPLPMGNSEQEEIFYIETIIKKGFIDSEGNVRSDSNLAVMTDYIPVFPNTLYNINRSISTSYTNLRFFDKNKNFLGTDSTEGIMTSDKNNNRMLANETSLSMTILNNNVAFMVFNDYSNDLNTTYTISTLSPTPDYPQPITNVTGDVEVKVQNKNLIDLLDINRTNNGITATVSNQIVALNGTATANAFIRLNRNASSYYFNLKKGTYTLSANNSIALSSSDSLRFVTLTGEAIAGLSLPLNQKNSSITFTINEDLENIQLQVRISSETTLDNFIIKPQLEKGSTATPYTPHKEQVFTFPLGNEKLMLGDYLADDGIHHKTRELNLAIADMNNGEDYPGWKGLSQLKADYPSINNSFTGAGINYKSNISNEAFRFSFNTLHEGVMWLPPSRWGNIKESQWKTNYPNLILKFQYELKEEIIVPYTSAQQEVYNQIKQVLSYEEQTNISSNTIALFNVEAYQSTKLVLEEMATAIVALGGV